MEVKHLIKIPSRSGPDRIYLEEERGRIVAWGGGGLLVEVHHGPSPPLLLERERDRGDGIRGGTDEAAVVGDAAG